MTTGWTGGQYSLLRAAFGTMLGVAAVGAMLQGGRALVPLGSFALACSLALAIGWQDRAAALALAFLWLLHMDAAPGQEMVTTAVALLLVLHAAQPAAPFGSCDARGRIDPGGGWTARRALALAAWLLLAVAQATAALHALGAAPHPAVRSFALFQLAFGPLALVPRLRPWLWLVSLVATLALHASGAAPTSLGMVMLHLFTFDPAWIPRRSPGVVETLFYDGACGLCHRAVRFVLAEDPEGRAFRFAPLGSEAFFAQVPEAERARLPDSLVLVTADGRVLTRAGAVRHLQERLGGIWRALALAVRIVPARVQDAAYDTIARIRHRVFARPRDACPILPSHLRARFLV